MPEDQSFFLFGPRTTGKSTLIQKYLNQCLNPKVIYDLLKYDHFLRLHADPSLLRRELESVLTRSTGKALQVHIDEIQKIPPLLDEIHALIERYPKKLRFLLSGSSARKLKRGGANLLAGRAWQRHLHPLTSLELGPQFSLFEMVQYGSLPAVVDRTREEKIEHIQAYVTTYLKEEIQTEALTRRLDAFHRFLEAAAKSNGELINMSNIAQEAMVPRRTVASYYQILEDTLIGFFLPSWGHRLSRQDLVTHGKFYFFDTGIVSGLNQNLTAALTDKHPLFGRYFEHFCILEFLRIHDYKRTQHRVGFFRTRTGVEIDLIQERGDRIRAIEIKAVKILSRGHLRGLKNFAERFPQAEKIMVCLAPQPLLMDNIACLPWREFLQREWKES